MSKIVTLTEALSWVAELFEEPVENIQPETPRDDIEGWDSLGILALMASLDEDFDIILSEDEFQELRKVEHILKTLEQNGCLK